MWPSVVLLPVLVSVSIGESKPKNIYLEWSNSYDSVYSLSSMGVHPTVSSHPFIKLPPAQR